MRNKLEYEVKLKLKILMKINLIGQLSMKIKISF